MRETDRARCPADMVLSMARTRPFDEHYEEYEEWFRKNHYAYLSELRALKHMTPPQERAVEIGIGTGRFAAPLGIKLGVEPSAPMRCLARKKGLRVLDGIAERLPFRNDTFEYALMVTTICFVDDLKTSFLETHRILKEGGLLVVGFVDRSSFLGRQYEDRKSENVFYRDAVFYSARDVVSVLIDSGFCLQSVIQTLFGNLPEIKSIQKFQTGHGEGGFVAIQAKKPLAEHERRSKEMQCD